MGFGHFISILLKFFVRFDCLYPFWSDLAIYVRICSFLNELRLFSVARFTVWKIEEKKRESEKGNAAEEESP